jgi:hypothetical protein
MWQLLCGGFAFAKPPHPKIKKLKVARLSTFRL